MLLNDALLSRHIQFVNVAAPSLATLWDGPAGSPIEVRAICTVQSMPYVLTTRNPNDEDDRRLHSDADRIAVPTVKISGQAMALQMAAAKPWGFDKYDKLDAFTVTMGHPDAMQSVLTGQTVNSHFTVAPFNYYELQHPEIHAVLKSYDTVGGKHTNGIQVTTKAFHDANPKICMAVRASHEEANAFIKREPKPLRKYLKLTNDKKNSANDLVKMITDPGIDTPQRQRRSCSISNSCTKSAVSSTCQSLGKTCSSARRTTSRAADGPVDVWRLLAP